MFNALIAMMSQTCSSVSEERFPQWRIQQLSIILVIEDLICLCCFQKFLSSAGTKKIVRGIDPKTRQIKQEDRYFLEIHALQMEYATAEDKIRVQKKSNDTEVLRNLISPSTEEPVDMKLSTSKREIGKSEVDKVSSDNDFPYIDPSSSRITFVRAPPIGLNRQKEKGQIECEIRTLTDC